MSYVSALYHIVFSTRGRKAALNKTHRERLFAFIAGTVRQQGCKPIIVNGNYDHVHMLVSLSAQVSLAELMRLVKSGSSLWIKQSGLFPLFDGWEREYGAFTLSESQRQSVYDYVASQEKHHEEQSLDAEYRRLVMKAGLVFYEPAH